MNQKEPLILQQFELPEVKASAAQFNYTKYCRISCGEKSFANFSNGVPNSSFGPQPMTLIATLTEVFHLAKRDFIQLVQDLYSFKIAEGAVIVSKEV